jgi:hypothetical protein
VIFLFIVVLIACRMNYFHFVSQNLPALHVLNGTLHADPSIRLLVYDKQHILEWLDLFGIEKKRLVLYDPCTIYSAKKVIYVEGGVLHASPAQAEALQTFVPPSPASERPLIIVIDRR